MKIQQYSLFGRLWRLLFTNIQNVFLLCRKNFICWSLFFGIDWYTRFVYFGGLSVLSSVDFSKRLVWSYFVLNRFKWINLCGDLHCWLLLILWISSEYGSLLAVTIVNSVPFQWRDNVLQCGATALANCDSTWSVSRCNRFAHIIMALWTSSRNFPDRSLEH